MFFHLYLIRFVFGVISVLLLARFVLMIFYPGTPETSQLFSLLRPVFPAFLSITDTLLLPLSLLLGWLQGFFPPTLRHFFPTGSAGQVLHWLASCVSAIPGTDTIGLRQKLMGTNFSHHYPGQLQWMCLLSVMFWSMIEVSVERYSLSLLKEFTNRLKPASQPALRTVSTHDLFIDNPQPMPEPQESPSVTQEHPPEPSEKPSVQAGQPLEIRQVLDSLSQENRRLNRQKEELRETFSVYMSPKVINYLQVNREFFEEYGNQRQVVTVMFCDIRNFTQFSHEHTPEETAKYLQEFFSATNQVILNQYEGTISKMMGDALMAYWGFPIPNSDHAFAATQAAISIQHTIEALNQRGRTYPLSIGVGISTGEVVVGNIGSKDFMDFTLVGDPVNLASRLDDANKQLGSKILISEETYRALNNRVLCRRVGPLEIKGWEETVYAFEPNA